MKQSSASIQVVSPRSSRRRRTTDLANLAHEINDLASSEGKEEVRLEVFVFWQAPTANVIDGGAQSVESSHQPCRCACHACALEPVP